MYDYCKQCVKQMGEHGPDCACRGCVRRMAEETGQKRCPKCGEIKSLDGFYKKRPSGGYQSYCIDCDQRAAKESRKKRRDNRTAEERARENLAVRLSMYNLTADDILELLNAQDGRCVCGAHLSVPTLTIDHDHACCDRAGSCGNCVRGVLCSGCNKALGLIQDDPNTALALAAYLMRFENVLRAPI